MIGDAKERRDAMRLRLLDLQRLVAESKRAWIVERINDQPTLVTLQAEAAQIRYDVNVLEQWIHGQVKAEEELAKAEFSATLIRLLAERGLGELVREARRRSNDALMAASVVLTVLPAVESGS